MVLEITDWRRQHLHRPFHRDVDWNMPLLLHRNVHVIVLERTSC